MKALVRVYDTSSVRYDNEDGSYSYENLEEKAKLEIKDDHSVLTVLDLNTNELVVTKKYIDKGYMIRMDANNKIINGSILSMGSKFHPKYGMLHFTKYLQYEKDDVPPNEFVGKTIYIDSGNRTIYEQNQMEIIEFIYDGYYENPVKSIHYEIGSSTPYKTEELSYFEEVSSSDNSFETIEGDDRCKFTTIDNGTIEFIKNPVKDTNTMVLCKFEDLIFSNTVRTKISTVTEFHTEF